MRLPGITYPLREYPAMIWRRFTGPVPLNGQPAAVDLALDEAAPTRWIGFVGDIAPLAGRQAVFSGGVRAFFDGCDVLVGNLEGVITDEPWYPLGHNHTPAIFEALEGLAPPERWVLSLANNHAADYGEEALYATLVDIEAAGMRGLGTRERPRLDLLAGLTLTAWSWWSNTTTSAIPMDDPGAPPGEGLHVAYPHWGYEHERTPRADVRARVPAGYGLVVGHHSHLPQPIEQLGDGRLVAWSLGNLLTRKRLPVLGEGALLKVGLADGAAAPRLARAHYHLVQLDRSDPAACRVHLRGEGPGPARAGR